LAFRSTYLRSFEGQNSPRKYYFVLGINRALLSIFSCFFTLWKMSFLWTPHSPPKFLPLNPPPPRNFQWPSVGGVWIFSGTTHSRLNSFVLVEAENKINHSCISWASSVQQNFSCKSNTLILQILDLGSRGECAAAFLAWGPACASMFSWMGAILILTSSRRLRAFSTGAFNCMAKLFRICLICIF